MLHHRLHTLQLALMVLVALLLVAGCRRDTAIRSEEELAYAADYEIPAHKWGFMDTTGQLVIPAIYDDVMAFSEGLACVNFEGKWGYIDRAGEKVIPPRFRAAWAFSEGFARIKPFDGQPQYLSKTGHILSGDEWIAEDDFNHGRARVRIGNVFGYIDTSGTLIIRGPFTSAGDFTGGIAIVTAGEKKGVIRRDGTYLIAARFEKIRKVADAQYLLCHIADSVYLYNASGDMLRAWKGVKIGDCSTAALSIAYGDNFRLLTIRDGLSNDQADWLNLIYLGSQRWAGKQERGYYLLDSNGRKLTQTPYKQINRFQHNVAACFDGQYWGYLDTMGRNLTTEVFGLAWDFREGFARVAFSDGIAFINDRHRLAFYPPPGTLDMRDFSEGLAPVQLHESVLE